MTETFKDWRGNPVRIGATVTWPSRQSSNMWMNEGVVVSLEQVPATFGYRAGQTDWKVGVRKVRQSIYGRTQKVTTTKVSYPAPERLTACGFFTAGDDRRIP